MKIRIGQGIDVHPLVTNRPFILGGIQIDHTHGLLGHSDADALIHAICDAMLGALSLGDIGKFFSDTDEKNKNRNSQEFLLEIYQTIRNHGYAIGNIDTTIVTEEPKLAPHIQDMRTNISEVLKINIDQISIKATRPERMGALGRKEGLLAMAVVLLTQN
ncbi:MAG: 2-C-methyl-D-erythritol 2,4-cyclodiphosphate synthase [Bdellovibrionales bacterium]|nr:2-C-methyl-D-erythritol 2,4-cyclodiphosphate synthase [Bdellovibrionales bacterium]